MKQQEYIAGSVTAEIMDEDYNFAWIEHKERFRKLLLMGLPGFIVGFVFFCVNMLPHATGDMFIFYVLAAGVAGIMCAAIPYGWKTTNKLLGQWDIFGNIIVIITFFFIKLALAMAIGIYAYPIALINNLIRSQQSKRNVKKWTRIVVSIVIIIFIAGIVVGL